MEHDNSKADGGVGQAILDNNRDMNHPPDQPRDALTHDTAQMTTDEAPNLPRSPTTVQPSTSAVPRPKPDVEEDRSVQNDSFSRQAENNPNYSMIVAQSRRNVNGTIGSVYSGNKIRHLKKEDGIPLWRKDIQYAFLRGVFEDDTPAFTLISDGTKGHTFAEIYIDAMARSSRTSKVLREKLLSDQGAATNMAMICLLVNVGRMNTTLNCERHGHM